MNANDSLAPLHISGPIATITLNRPERRNAFSLELLAALHAALDELDRTLAAGSADPPTVLVVTGAGPAFCAGMDLAQVVIAPELGGMGDPTLPKRLLASLASLTRRLRLLELVTIAKVNGAAIGGGCGMACVLDLAVTHEDAKLGFPEVDLGLCPAVVAPWVVGKIGAGRARGILLSGGVMTGAAARAAGLVDELAPGLPDLDQTTADLAARVASGGSEALAATKRLLNDLDRSVDEATLERGVELSASVIASERAQTNLAQRLAERSG